MFCTDVITKDNLNDRPPSAILARSESSVITSQALFDFPARPPS